MQKSIRSISRQCGFMRWDFQKRTGIELSFDGEKITVRPLASTDSELFRRNAEQKGHQLKEYRYYDGDTLCTVILADFTAEQICIENKVDEILDTAVWCERNALMGSLPGLSGRPMHSENTKGLGLLSGCCWRSGI